jgi:hypothetical protein
VSRTQARNSPAAADSRSPRALGEEGLPRPSVTAAGRTRTLRSTAWAQPDHKVQVGSTTLAGRCGTWSQWYRRWATSYVCTGAPHQYGAAVTDCDAARWKVEAPDRRLFARLDDQRFGAAPAQIIPIWRSNQPTGKAVRAAGAPVRAREDGGVKGSCPTVWRKCAVGADHWVPLAASTLRPPSWTSKMKCGAGSSLQ